MSRALVFAIVLLASCSPPSAVQPDVAEKVAHVNAERLLALFP